VIDSDGARKADLAAIDIGKAALGWDDDFYRSILKAKCGVGSAALLDHAGRKRFLDHLRGLRLVGHCQGRGLRRKTRQRRPLRAAQLHGERAAPTRRRGRWGHHVDRRFPGAATHSRCRPIAGTHDRPPLGGQTWVLHRHCRCRTDDRGCRALRSKACISGNAKEIPDVEQLQQPITAGMTAAMPCTSAIDTFGAGSLGPISRS
jgi:hypothetical protein